MITIANVVVYNYQYMLDPKVRNMCLKPWVIPHLCAMKDTPSPHEEAQQIKRYLQKEYHSECTAFVQTTILHITLSSLRMRMDKRGS